MRVSVQTRDDGSVDLQLDVDAAQAVFASVLFASRFHEGIAVLATALRCEVQLPMLWPGERFLREISMQTERWQTRLVPPPRQVADPRIRHLVLGLMPA